MAEVIIKETGDLLDVNDNELILTDLIQASADGKAKTLSGKNVYVSPTFDSDWITPTLGVNSKIDITHGLGVIPSNVVLQVSVDTSSGQFDEDLYTTGDVVMVPLNSRDSDDAGGLSGTGMYCILSNDKIKLMYHTYVGAMQADGNMTNGFIKIKQFRILAWR